MNSAPQTQEQIARAILDLFVARKLPAGEPVTLAQLRFVANAKWNASFAFDEALRYGVDRGWFAITQGATIALTPSGYELSGKSPGWTEPDLTS